MSISTEGLTGDSGDVPRSRAGSRPGGDLGELGLPALASALHEGVAVLDASGHVIARNAAFAEMTGGAERLDDVRDEHGRPLAPQDHPWAAATGTSG